MLTTAETLPGDESRFNAELLEVDVLVQKAVRAALQVVNEVSSLAFSLEAGASPQIDSALVEAEQILEVSECFYLIL